eukprot:358412-Chlamydomonas_euryale.AAC.3
MTARATDSQAQRSLPNAAPPITNNNKDMPAADMAAPVPPAVHTAAHTAQLPEGGRHTRQRGHAQSTTRAENKAQV